MLWSILVGIFIGAVAGRLTNRPAGCLTKVMAGWIGSAIGQSLFGYWGPSLAGMAILPSILGAIILIALLDLFFGK